MRRLLFVVLLGVCATSCGNQPAPPATPAEPVPSTGSAPPATPAEPVPSTGAAPPATVKDFYEHWARAAFWHLYGCAYDDIQGLDGKIEQDVRNALIEICSEMDCSERLSIGLDGPAWQECLNELRAIPCDEAMIAPDSCEIDRFQ